MICTDERDEKAQIWKAMVEEKGDMSVEMTAKLERVQWITIIKNDLNATIFNPLIETFVELEKEGSLSVSNETDLFCLHFVYLPRINKALQDFVTSYNSCCIPKGNGATPSQIFYAHNESVTDLNSTILQNLTKTQGDGGAMVNLEHSSPLPVAKLKELYEHVNPLDASADHGKELYYRTGTFVTQFLKEILDSGTTIVGNETNDSMDTTGNLVSSAPQTSEAIDVSDAVATILKTEDVVQTVGQDESADCNDLVVDGVITELNATDVSDVIMITLAEESDGQL